MIRFWMDFGWLSIRFWKPSWIPNPTKLEPKSTRRLKQDFDAFLGGGFREPRSVGGRWSPRTFQQKCSRAVCSLRSQGPEIFHYVRSQARRHGGRNEKEIFSSHFVKLNKFFLKTKRSCGGALTILYNIRFAGRVFRFLDLPRLA